MMHEFRMMNSFNKSLDVSLYNPVCFSILHLYVHPYNMKRKYPHIPLYPYKYTDRYIQRYTNMYNFVQIYTNLYMNLYIPSIQVHIYIYIYYLYMYMYI